MAITWGAIAGGYGRIGIDIAISNTATQSKVTVTTWFWSKYSVSDTGNSYYYNANATSATSLVGSKTLKTTNDSGNGWNTANQVKLGQSTYTYDKGTSARTINYAIKLTGVDRVGATMTHTRGVTIPALAKYTVSYNANGGSGAPENQTKYHGKTLTLSKTVPTRSGYTFVGWSLNEVSTSWYYQPGSECGRNENVKLYAVWNKTITLSYNANGGSGEPGSQSATVYNATTSNKFTISSTKPTRTGYTFQGWATSASGGVAYNAGGSISLSSNGTLYAVWKINTWTVTYDANGGTNPPPAQTKTYGTDLVLSSSTPTRSGYNFKGWATSSGGSVAYNAGAVYKTNDNLTLHAVWERAIFVVSYNANLGSNAPASQQKIYGTDLTLTSAIPTRKHYAFKGWAESPSGNVVYNAGDTYKANADITLYAVWEVAYTIPRITMAHVNRCDENGLLQDDGTYALVNFNWATDEDVVQIAISWGLSTDVEYGNHTVIEATGRSGHVSKVVGDGALSEDFTYIFKIDVRDTTDYNSVIQAIYPTVFPIDMKAGGYGVTIGGPAKEDGFNVLMQAYFDAGFINPVLPIGTNLNDVMLPNVYTSFPASDNAYANCPFTDGTFVLEVYSSGPEEQVYQRISTCNKNDPDVYVRFYYGDSWGDWICANGDFIIERGSHDFWVYRKYASGDAECWGIYWKPAADYNSPAVDTGWYFDGDSTKVSFPPNLFSTGPYSIIAQPIYAHASTHFGISWADKNEICGWVNVVRQETNATIGISFHVKGWWK